MSKKGEALRELGLVKPGPTAQSQNALKRGKQLVREIPEAAPAPPPPPPPPTTTALDWGARIYGRIYSLGDPPWDLGAWDTFERHAGKKVTILSYGNPFGQVQKGQPLEHCAQRKAVPLLTVMCEGTNIERIAAGNEDAKIDQMAQALAGTQRVVLRFAHEMNGKWYDAYGYTHFSPATYVRGFRRVASRMSAAANVEMCWCPNVIGGSSVDDPAAWYPGDDAVDIVGIDGYNQSGLTTVDVFSPTVERLNQIAPGKPQWICEVGCKDNFGKGAWLKSFLTHDAPLLGVLAVVYFNGDPVEGDPPERKTWPIESAASATQGFREGIAADIYKGTAL